MDAQSEALLVGTRNWVWGLRRECHRLGYELPLSTQRARRVDVQYVLGLQATQQQRAWEALSVCPRTCRTEGAAKCTYWRGFSRRGSRCACGSSGSGTRRGASAAIYGLDLAAAHCQW